MNRKGVVLLVAVLSAAGIIYSMMGSAQVQPQRTFEAAEVRQIMPTQAEEETIRRYDNISWSNNSNRFVVDAWDVPCSGDEVPAGSHLVVRDASDSTGTDLDIAETSDNLKADITAWTCDDENVVFPTNPGGTPGFLAYVKGDGSMKGASEPYLQEEGINFDSPSIICDYENNIEYLAFIENPMNSPTTYIAAIVSYTIGGRPVYAEKKVVVNATIEEGGSLSWIRLNPAGRPSPTLDKAALSTEAGGEGTMGFITGISSILAGTTEPITTIGDERVTNIYNHFTDPPTWSLDGNYLVYKDFTQGIMMLNVSDVTDITNLSALGDKKWYSFSANGAWIGYSDRPTGEACVNARALYVLPVISKTGIDQAGGDANDVGYSKVVVPEDAVNTSTEFLLQAPAPGSINPGAPSDVTETTVIREMAAERDGEPVTEFNGELNVTLHYLDKEISDADITDETKLNVYVLNETNNEWEEVLDADGNPVTPTIDAENNTVTIPTTHFSTYSIVGESGGGGGGSTSSSGCSLIRR